MASPFPLPGIGDCAEIGGKRICVRVYSQTLETPTGPGPGTVIYVNWGTESSSYFYLFIWFGSFSRARTLPGTHVVQPAEVQWEGARVHEAAGATARGAGRRGARPGCDAGRGAGPRARAAPSLAARASASPRAPRPPNSLHGAALEGVGAASSGRPSA